MIPESITLRSFKCFSGETTFEFPKQPGLYLIQGENKIQPQLEGNGCGKSTLLGDALAWCFFGKTPRLLKAGDVINWEAGSSASVQFKFNMGGTKYAILRTQTPNSLCLDVDGVRQTATQDQIDHLLGLDFEGFITSIVFAQFNSMFFDLTSAEKSTLLSKILNLDLWDVAVDMAKKSVAQLESSLNVVLRDISRIEGQLEGLQAQNFKEKIQNWEELQQQKVNELQKELVNPQKIIKKVKERGLVVEKHLKKVEDELSEVVILDQELCLDVKKLEKVIQDIRNQIANNQGMYKQAKKEFEKFESVDKTCPYCNQEVSEEHLKVEIERCGFHLSRLHEESVNLEFKMQNKNGDLKELYTGLEEISSIRQELSEEKRQIVEEKAQLKAEVVSAMTLEKSLTTQWENLQKEVNPYVLEERKQQQQVGLLQDNLKIFVEKTQSIEKELYATQFWVKSFKEVRLSLISEVLTQLELEVNNKLFQLGLQDWKVLFAVEGLTKGGKVKKGFTVTIITPYNLEPVNWNAWSGGESQRLRLAGSLGIADLITSRCPYVPTFEVFDEPSSYLSEAGITSLLDILADRARLMNKQIFLIDHRRLDSTKFDGVISVVKTHDGVEVNTTYA